MTATALQRSDRSWYPFPDQVPPPGYISGAGWGRQGSEGYVCVVEGCGVGGGGVLCHEVLFLMLPVRTGTTMWGYPATGDRWENRGVTGPRHLAGRGGKP